MDEARSQPATSALGTATLVVWVLYLLSAAIFYFPDYPASVWPIAGGGVLACLAVVLGFAFWRPIVILASCVYVAFYVVRVGRMVVLTSGFDLSSLPTALSFYFKSLWLVTTTMPQEKGIAATLMHGYIEYAMPLLSLALIALIWMARRSPTR